MHTTKMTETEYKEHEADMNGLCTECGEFRYGMTEGDAEGYTCEECGADAVLGMSNCLMEGRIEIVEEE